MTYRSSFMKAKDVADWLGVSESAIIQVGERRGLS
jgi:DNA-binding MurR/RpiR family transcriptional regulator